MPKLTIDRPEKENFRFDIKHKEMLRKLAKKLKITKTQAVERALEGLEVRTKKKKAN